MKEIAKITWTQGQKVHGLYCGKIFNGFINDNTRNVGDVVIFGVTLIEPINIFGKERTKIEVVSNSLNNEIFL